MATCLQFALSNPVAGQEEEFNRWYGSEHLIHGVRTPGVLAGQRFRRGDGPWPSGKHDYLMIWEMDDPAFALDQLASVKNTAAMPISPAIDMTTVQPPTFWRRATVHSSARIATDTAVRQTVVLMLANAGEGQGDAFEAALLRGGLAELADQPGVIVTDLLTLAEQQIRGNARKFPFALLVELHHEPTALAALAPQLPALPHLDRERWLATVFRPIGERMTTADARRLVAEHA
jgi:hypothetical protein